MVTNLLPDSNYYIGCARRRIDPFAELAAHTDEWELVTCGMVIVEVCRGRRDPLVLRRFRDAFSVMTYVSTTSLVWERTAHLTWALDRQGIVLPASDVLIAACALAAGATVLTFDAHFRQIPGLRVVSRLG